MKAIYLAGLCLLLSAVTEGQYATAQKSWTDVFNSRDTHLKNIIRLNSLQINSPEEFVRVVNESADNTYSIAELTTVVRMARDYCNDSKETGLLLTGWLREDHKIYKDKTPTETNQFRSFLLASLAAFPPNDNLYQYIKSELLFPSHAINIAAASLCAGNFPQNAGELISLMEPFLRSSFMDEWVDLTTPRLNYPVEHPTKARYEIISTFTKFAPASYRSISLLRDIVRCGNCDLFGWDSLLARKANIAAAFIVEKTPSCCRKPVAMVNYSKPLQVISRAERKFITEMDIRLLDQEGQQLRFADLRGKPFVLTFFYTQCSNPTKCVSTVQRLRDLRLLYDKNNKSGRVGIYAMTYDPDFDTPAILKKYGSMYGVKFSDDMRFLKTTDQSYKDFSNDLQVRVNYGAGTVNGHGIQLLLFDRNGRIAAVCDNDLWDINEVSVALNRLVTE